MKNFPADHVIRIYNLLKSHNINVVIDGGWGIDALLGEQTRTHKDLDIAVEHKDVPKLRELLKAQGFEQIDHPNTKDYNFVLSNEASLEVDVHSYTFDSQGNNIYGITYPTASLTGKGVINGQEVRCIALEWVIKFHENYELDERGKKDIKALMDKFNLKPSKNN